MVGFSTLQNDTSDLMGWQRLIARGTAGFIKTAGILLAAVALILLAGMPTAAHAESIDVTPHPKWLDDFCIGQEQCATGDFNGDGRTDVLAFIRDTRSGSEQGDVYVALSNGSSFLPATKWHDFFCTGSEVCQVGDFNGDGKDDIITFTRSSYTGDATGDVYVALSNGSSFGTSTKWHNYFCIGQEVCNVGDFNGDGKADIVSFTRSSYSGDAVGDVYVALSNGHSFGSGAKWHSFFCINQEQCGVGDFNGDGRDDIVSFTKGSSADVFVALSSGSGFGTGNKWNGFFCAGDEVCGVGDFDGDGKDDVITFLRNGYNAETKGDIYVGLSNGSSFQSGPKWNNYFCIGQEVCGTGDFNGDGRDDVITFLRDTQSGNARGDVFVAIAMGTAHQFKSAGKWQDSFCTGQEQCAEGDFNGDGKKDILSFIGNTQGGSSQGDVNVALSNGTSFGASTKWHDFFCTGQELCKVGDVNGDGKDDIVSFVRSSQGGSAQGDVYVALSNGASFGAKTLWNGFFCLGSEVCDIGDFNGDGKADIISFTRSSYSGDAVGDVYVALSNGHSFGSGAKWHSFFCINQEQCGVGDFNGDGRDDIVSFTKGSSADVFVALSSGSGFGTGNKWNGFFCAGDEVCGVGDFDGDGKDDVVTFLRNGYDAATKGDVYVGLSTGSGFQSNPKWNNYFCIGQEVCGTGDFNGDGRDDVITFLRDTQSGNARGDVDVALAKGTGYSFAYLTQNTYLPVIIK